tara:strand:- start:49132 stop:49638 length:507 start_codon:yes stop_codon:yes gene_type:complete
MAPLADWIILCLIAGPLITTIGQYLFATISILTLFFVIYLTQGFRAKKKRFLNTMIVFNHVIMRTYMIVAVFWTIIAISGSSIPLLIQCLMLALMSFVKKRENRRIRHPSFTSWYFSNEESEKILSEDEVYATCPDCDSLLAVIPSKLQLTDRCPNCDGLLVKTPEAI